MAHGLFHRFIPGQKPEEQTQSLPQAPIGGLVGRGVQTAARTFLPQTGIITSQPAREAIRQTQQYANQANLAYGGGLIGRIGTQLGAAAQLPAQRQEMAISEQQRQATQAALDRGRQSPTPATQTAVVGQADAQQMQGAVQPQATTQLQGALQPLQITSTDPAIQDIARQLNQVLSQAQQLQSQQGKMPTPEEINKSRQEAVQDLINQGITDPAQIQDYLNKLDTGQVVGDFTAQEIQSRISNINNLQAQETASLARINSYLQNNQYAEAVAERNRRAELERQKTEEITNFYQTQFQPLKEQILKASIPGAEEKTLRQELDKFRAEAQLGIERELTGGTVKPLELAVGRAGALQRESIIKEKFILDKLGFAQDTRRAELEAAKTGLSLLESDVNLRFKVQDRLSKIDDGILDRAKDLNDSQRQQFADILSWAKETNVNVDALPPLAKQQLGNLAAQRGWDPELLFSGMRNEYAKEQLGLEKTRLEIAGYRKTRDYDIANKFISDNPTVPYSVLFNNLLQNTRLTGQEADALLASRGIKKTQISVLDKMKSIIQQHKDLGRTRKEVEKSLKTDLSLSKIPDNINNILNEVYGVSSAPTKPWWQFW